MNKTVKGYVIKQTEVKESDAFVTIIDEDSQLVSFYAHGIRKPKSKNSFACSLFAHSEFVLQSKDGNRWQIQSSNCLKSHHHLYEEYEKLIYANIMCDMVNDICAIDNVPLYSVFTTALAELQQRNDSNLVLLLYLVSILRYLGIQIVVDGCCICGSQTVNSISIHDGGFLCENCRNEYARLYEEDILRKFRYINKAEFSHMDELEQTGEFPDILIEILYQFMRKYTGIASRSIAFLADISKMKLD